MPVPGAATRRQGRTAADAYLGKLTGGKLTSVGQLAQFAGNNQPASNVRGQLNKYLRSSTNSVGIADYKQLLTPAERQRLMQVNAPAISSNSNKSKPVVQNQLIDGAIGVGKDLLDPVWNPSGRFGFGLCESSKLYGHRH